MRVVLDADAAGEGEILVGDVAAGTKGTVSPTFGEGRNLIASLQDRYNNLPARLAEVEGQMARAEERIARLEKLLAHPSDAPTKIATARQRIATIEAELRAESAIKDAEAQRAHREDDLARRQAGTQSSEGDYAELPTSAGTAQIVMRPIEFPELLEIAKMLELAPTTVVEKFGGPHTRGQFRHPTEATINGRPVTPEGCPHPLADGSVQKGNEHQLAAVIAHEIGHAADWLPDYVLKRGNLLGHLRTLEESFRGPVRRGRRDHRQGRQGSRRAQGVVAEVAPVGSRAGERQRKNLSRQRQGVVRRLRLRVVEQPRPG